jgi:nucleoside-diphosphate-sugar epimerase
MLPQESQPAGGSATALITGATGFLGHRLAEIIAGRGDVVRALVRPGRNARALMDLPVQIAQGDLRRSDHAGGFDARCRCRDSCAGLSADWGRWQAFYAANVQGVENLLAAAHAGSNIERPSGSRL